jgi:2-C-methyl-D-erythritol 4-phosphate cytidylyltransferase
MSRTPVTGIGPRACPRRPAGNAAVVVLAGGSGSRVGGSLNKVYLPLAGRRLISWSFTWASEVTSVGHLVLVIRPEDAELAEHTLHREAPSGPPIELVIGGNTRHGSEQAALDHLAPRIRSGEVEVVAIHDGARPLAGPALFRTVISTAASVGGAVPALPALGVLPVDAGPGTCGSSPASTAADGTARRTAGSLTRVQTPQAFRAPELLRAYTLARTEGHHGTDTACSIERYGELTVRMVAGGRHNLKVTYPHDVFLAERLLAANHYRMP